MSEPTSAVPRARRSVSFRALALIATALVLLASLGVYIAYRQLIHYERRAVEHLPLNTALVARLDLEQVVLFEPVRRHLLPVVNALPLGGQPAPNAGIDLDRLAMLRELAGINLGFDLREIVVAVVAPTGGWAVVLGGLFDKDRMLEGVERLLRAEGVAWSRVGDTLRLEFLGVALGQAQDGSLIVASSPEVLESALPATHRYRELRVSKEGAGGIFFAPDSLRRWLGDSVAWLGGSWLTRLEHVAVSLELGERLELVGRFEVEAASDLERVAQGIQTWLRSFDSLARFVPKADWGGERAILARARLVETSATSLKLTSAWERSEFERALRSLAAWLERRFRARASEQGR